MGKETERPGRHGPERVRGSGNAGRPRRRDRRLAVTDGPHARLSSGQHSLFVSGQSHRMTMMARQFKRLCEDVGATD
jgi:hypothetical protein